MFAMFPITLISYAPEAAGRMESCMQTSSTDGEGSEVPPEGSDPLTLFFRQNSRLKDEWRLKMMENGLAYEDLMESAESDLREVLEDILKDYRPKKTRHHQDHQRRPKGPEIAPSPTAQ